MAELILPKFGDLKSIQGISRIIVAPMITGAYIAQSGLSIENQIFSLNIPETGSFTSHWYIFIAIFLIKTAQVFVVFYIPIITIKSFQLYRKFDYFKVGSVLFLAFSFSGFFGTSNITFFNTVHHSWYYTSFIIGIYLLHEHEDIKRT